MVAKKNIEKVCKVCGSSWLSWNNDSRFCSADCFNTYKYETFIKKWLRGEVSGGRKKGYGRVSNHVRKWVFEKYGNKCSICGWSKTNTFTNSIPLEVEHLDGNPENHSSENLTLLCPNCHSLTIGDTDKEINGRRYYREHYLKVK